MTSLFHRILLTAGLIFATASAYAQNATAPKPTLENVPYGSHERQTLDFYQAKSGQPTPLIFSMHSGGWMNGDKKEIWSVDNWLAAGISVVSINYRFIPDAAASGATPPVKVCLNDAARALQFVKSRAKEWNIDPDRICVSGASAGGFMALWLAFHSDLADAANADPIAHESTRVRCAVVYNPQTSLDPLQLRQWVSNYDYGHHAFLLPSFQSFLDQREKLLPWIKEFSPYELVSTSVPPIYLSYSTAPEPKGAVKDPPHSANQGVGLAEKLKKIGVDFELNYPGAQNLKHADPIGFVLQKMKNIRAPATPATASAAPAPDDGPTAPLLDFDSPKIKPIHATATVVETQGIKALQAVFEEGIDYPAIEFPLPEERNFSAFSGIETEVTNVGPSAVKVALRVDNPGEWKDEPFNSEVDAVAAGETKRIAVVFGKSYGAPGFPLNPARVTKIMIMVAAPAQPATLLIRRLEPFGPLLK